MASADLIAACLLAFIAPIILYFAKQYAIRSGWLSEPTTPSGSTDQRHLGLLLAILNAVKASNESNGRLREEQATSFNDIKESLDRLIQLSEARERNGGMLIYQRIPTPHVPSAAEHLDG